MAARARELVGSGRFELLEMPMEGAELPAGRADLVQADYHLYDRDRLQRAFEDAA